MIKNLFPNFIKQVDSPNILLTNVCNQQCTYCFAKNEMEKSNLKEMPIKNFKKVVEWLNKNNIKTLRLMGGEPTLHTKFESVVNIANKNFGDILIFSNGIIPKKAKQSIFKYINKMSFNFNIDTFAFNNEPNKRKEIISNIKEFSDKTNLNIGFTLSDLNKNYKNIIKYFDKNTLAKMGIRFGIAKPIVGANTFFGEKDFKQIGKKIIELVIFFKKSGIKNIYIDCGLRESMFTKKDLDLLKENVFIKGWACKGKWSSFDITPDLYAFSCFPYYLTARKKIDFKKSVYKTQKILEKNKVICF